MRVHNLDCILAYLLEGGSCSVIGPSNIGKSHLLRTLVKRDGPWRQALEAEGCLILLIDCLPAADSVGPMSENKRTFVMDVLNELIKALESVEPRPEAAIRTLQAIYADTQRNPHHDMPSVFMTYLVNGIEAALADPGRSLILLLDEFDNVLGPRRTTRLFRVFRALRNDYGERIRYVVATVKPLDTLPHIQEAEEFTEMFEGRWCYLQPLDEDDAGRYAGFLAHQRSARLDDGLTALLFELSGGHPALMGRLEKHLLGRQTERVGMLHMIDQMLDRDEVQEECRRLWDDLTEPAQQALRALGLRRPDVDADGLELLTDMGLLRDGLDGRTVVFSPLVERYLQLLEGFEPEEASPAGLSCDARTKWIWLDGREISGKLTPILAQLLRALAANVGSLCSHDDLIQTTWPGDRVDRRSRELLTEHLRRLRKRLKAIDPHGRDFIENTRGMGYSLIPDPPIPPER